MNTPSIFLIIGIIILVAGIAWVGNGEHVLPGQIPATPAPASSTIVTTPYVESNSNSTNVSPGHVLATPAIIPSTIATTPLVESNSNSTNVSPGHVPATPAIIPSTAVAASQIEPDPNDPIIGTWIEVFPDGGYNIVSFKSNGEWSWQQTYNGGAVLRVIPPWYGTWNRLANGLYSINQSGSSTLLYYNSTQDTIYPENARTQIYSRKKT
jgi:hypothetical protein